MVVGSMATAMALTANRENKEELKLPEELTKEDLQKLYKKYNITENDIKFAEGKLPHYLKGTILDGSKKVIVTENIKQSKLKERIKYDLIITKKKAISIMEEAREDYIKKYGVDPNDQKVDIVNGVSLPKEYVKELVKSGKLSLESTEAGPLVSKNSVGVLSGTYGPHAINGKVYVFIFVAKVDGYGHEPDGTAWYSYTLNALNRFESEFNVEMIDDWCFGCWDASDVREPGTTTSDIYECLYDLEQDHGDARDADNEIVLGWIDNTDKNGVARKNGFFAVASETAQVSWPEDSIVQHEISHNFNADEGGWWPWEHPECIMNYWYAYHGTDIWCSEHWNTVYNNIWDISD